MTQKRKDKTGKLRLAIITDIHYGFDTRGKMGSKAPRLMKKFAKAVKHFMPDAIIDIGDRISTKNTKDDTKHMEGLKKHFNKMAAPTYHVLGNHDVVNVDRHENKRITNSPSGNYSLDKGGYHLVFFNPGEHSKLNRLVVTKEDLDWLKNDLEKTNKPTIVFSHVPLDNVSEDREAKAAISSNDNKDFAARFGYPKQGPEIRKILEKSGKVILSMSGHIHANRYRKINDIHYISQQSLTSTYQHHYRVPSGTYSILDLEDGKITVRLKGKAEITIDHKRQKTYTLIPKMVRK